MSKNLEFLSKKYNTKYYYNNIENTVSWVKTDEKSITLKKLPTGWMVKYSEKYPGTFYYTDRSKSQWKLPDKSSITDNNDCLLDVTPKERPSSSLLHIFESKSFTLKYSRIGGLLDIRPKISISGLLKKYRDKWSKSDGLGNGLDVQYVASYNCDELSGLFVSDYSVCRGLTKVMYIVQTLLNRTDKSIDILPFNVDNNGKYFISSTIPKCDRCMILIASRTRGEYGHYLLGIIENDTCYLFDSEGKTTSSNMKVTKQLLKNTHVTNVVDIYTLNPSCIKTEVHQYSGEFCSIWTASLALLVGLNQDKTIKEIFTYFAYKAPTKKYLKEKIKLFTIYLIEKGAEKITQSDVMSITKQKYLVPMYEGSECRKGPPLCN